MQGTVLTSLSTVTSVRRDDAQACGRKGERAGSAHAFAFVSRPAVRKALGRPHPRGSPGPAGPAAPLRGPSAVSVPAPGPSLPSPSAAPPEPGRDGPPRAAGAAPPGGLPRGRGALGHRRVAAESAGTRLRIAAPRRDRARPERGTIAGRRRQGKGQGERRREKEKAQHGGWRGSAERRAPERGRAEDRAQDGGDRRWVGGDIYLPSPAPSPLLCVHAL